MNNINFELPQKGDKIFSSENNARSNTNCDLEHILRLGIDCSALSDAFKNSADIIIEELNKDESPRTGIEFFPIAYLYRHSLELKMKGIIQISIQRGAISIQENESKELLGRHNLSKLFKKVKDIIMKTWTSPNREEKEQLEGSEKIVEDFHKIDEGGQNLRYPKTKKGEPAMSPEAISMVDLLSLKENFHKLNNYLEGCEVGIEKLWIKE